MVCFIIATTFTVLQKVSKISSTGTPAVTYMNSGDISFKHFSTDLNSCLLVSALIHHKDFLLSQSQVSVLANQVHGPGRVSRKE